jgi:hypothetical protein
VSLPDFSWIVDGLNRRHDRWRDLILIIGFELFGEGRLFERGGRRLPLVVAMLLRMIIYSRI